MATRADSLSKSQSRFALPTLHFVSFPLNSVDESMRVPAFHPCSCHKASRLTISSVSGGLVCPRRSSESHAGEGGLELDMGMGFPENPAGTRRPACQSCSNTVTRNAALADLAVSPYSPARPQLPGLGARVGLRGRRIRKDLPSRRWAAGGEARTSTQPASSRVSNFLHVAFAESLFLQKHRST